MIKNAKLKIANGKTVPCTIKVWDKLAARKKGVKIAGIVLGVALFTIFIPLIHFISVPGGILMAPIAGYMTYKLYFGSEDIIAADAQCPKCASELAIREVSITREPQVSCKKCNEVLSIQIVE